MTGSCPYPLLGPLGMNHGTTAPTISQKKLMIGKATANDVFTIFSPSSDETMFSCWSCDKVTR